jgi:hypothetical protein
VTRIVAAPNEGEPVASLRMSIIAGSNAWLGRGVFDDNHFVFASSFAAFWLQPTPCRSLGPLFRLQRMQMTFCYRVGAFLAVKLLAVKLIVLNLLVAMLLATVLQAGESVSWNPLGKVEREADTLFLADFTSAATIEAQGGYLLGLHNDWSKKAPVHENYEFGPGRSGPAIRGKESKPDTGAYSFVQYALDGILPADEFTVELSFKADKPWAEMFTGRGFFSMLGSNSLNVMNEKTSLVILASDGKGSDRRVVIELSQFPLDDQKWHSLAFTWKRPVLTIWLDGKQAAEIPDVAWNPLWSDSTHADGILIGGTPGAKSPFFWVSDLRVSRTARIPGVATPLRSLTGNLTIDAAKSEGPIAPYPLGSLHPGATPELVQSALQVVRTDKLLTATPIKRGAPDATHPTAGISGKFSYDWQVCDRTFAWFKNNNVRPCISIDSTPQLLGGSVPPYSGKRLQTELSYLSGYSTETPNNWDDWALIVGDLIDHVGPKAEGRGALVERVERAGRSRLWLRRPRAVPHSLRSHGYCRACGRSQGSSWRAGAGGVRACMDRSAIRPLRQGQTSARLHCLSRLRRQPLLAERGARDDRLAGGQARFQDSLPSRGY